MSCYLSELARTLVGPYVARHMAITTIKSTYALDVESVKALEGIAQRWGVSKSEALRRAIRAAANLELQSGEDALRALDELQRSVASSKRDAILWARRTRDERRASSARGEAPLG